MPNKKPTLALWIIITIYTGVIYATLPLVSKIRKSLVERFGYNVYNYIYVIFGIIALWFIIYVFRKIEKKNRIKSIAVLVAVGAVYWYYLSGLKYAVEKIHFLEYGILGGLLVVAIHRKIPNVTAFLLAACTAYWIGLGDEAIQWALPSRVGEMHDSIINFISGVLGIVCVWGVFLESHPSSPVKKGDLKLLIAACALSAILTGLFLAKVHGFGYRYEAPDPGVIYSSLSSKTLKQINSPKSAEELPTQNELDTYGNEALRHLLQRDFYLTNDFLIKGGGFYREHWKSWMENRILEVHYRFFLESAATESSGKLIGTIDKELGEKTAGYTVKWADTLRTQVESRAGNRNALYKSRVKSTIITTYGPEDVMFYLVLICGICLYLYFLVSRKEEKGTA